VLENLLRKVLLQDLNAFRPQLLLEFFVAAGVKKQNHIYQRLLKYARGLLSHTCNLKLAMKAVNLDGRADFYSYRGQHWDRESVLIREVSSFQGLVCTERALRATSDCP